MSDRTEQRLAFGAQLRTLMIARDLSPRTVAKRALGDARKDNLVASWMAGLQMPSKANAERLSHFFEVDIVAAISRPRPVRSHRKPLVQKGAR